MLSIVAAILKKYLIKLASEEFIKWALFEIADALVKSTKSPHDNNWLEKIKEVTK